MRVVRANADPPRRSRRQALTLLAVVALATAGASWSAGLSLALQSGSWSGPGGVGTGLLVWYDASEAASIGLVPHLRYWFDKSGTERDARPSGPFPSAYATLVSAKPQVSLPGTPLHLPSPIAYAPTTIVVVLRSPASTAVLPLVGSSSSTNGIAVDASRIRVYGNNSSLLSTTFGSVVGDCLVTIRMATSGSNYVSLNGGSELAFTGLPTGTADLVGGVSAFGIMRAFNGSIMEFVVWGRSLTSTERQSVQRALGAKWGIAVP